MQIRIYIGLDTSLTEFLILQLTDMEVYSVGNIRQKWYGFFSSKNSRNRKFTIDYGFIEKNGDWTIDHYRDMYLRWRIVKIKNTLPPMDKLMIWI